MEPITVVRCPACGYDGNNPFFRFCGICGTALQKEMPPTPTPVKPQTKAPAKARPSPALAISSFSILGLQDEPVLTGSPEEAREDLSPKPLPSSGEPGVEFSHSASYLLEEDETRSPRWRLYAMLAVFVIGAGVLAWEWQRDGAPWRFFVTVSSSENHAAPAHEAAAPSKSLATAASGITAAAPPPAPETILAPDTAETPSRQSLPETQVTPAAVPDGKAASVVPPQPANPSASVTPREANPGAGLVAKPSAAPPAAPGSAAPNTSDSHAVAAPQPATISAADATQLFEEGQKYLYGNGVKRDCGLALQDLRQSARTNAEAASLLGTMYASGHCVGRNLAPAYHWYARALHRDPTNTRYQSDLTVLWNQMTPAEKQAALRIAP